MNKNFSIIIPIYNVAKYLSKCLDSIINQTYKNIEIICINDGSTDNSLQILEEYSKKDNRIKIINQENHGVSVARNIGIDNATGDYILFVDSDDWLELNTCEILLKKIINDNYDMIYFNHYLVNSKIKREIKNTHNVAPDNILDYFWNNISTFCCFCYKTDFLKYNKIKFPESIKFSEDHIFKFLTLLYNPNIIICQNALYNYFFTRENSATKNYRNGIKENIKAFNYFKNMEMFKQISNKQELLIIDNWAKLIFGMWSTIPYKNLDKDFDKQIKEFLQNYKKFNYKDYKNLTGYRRLKNKWFIRILKNIRDFFFSVICRTNKDAK